MTTVVLVVLEDALSSCLASWEDLFAYANRLSLRRGGPALFAVVRWAPHDALPQRPDVVLIPARVAGGVGIDVAEAPGGLVHAVREWSSAGTLVGAVCAGVFCLAETGLLDGRRATTHWSLTDAFRRRFPAVTLDPDCLVIEETDLVVGGGMTAYFDVGLRLVARFGDAALARDCAAVFVLEPGRRLQSPFAPAVSAIETDPVLGPALAWAEAQVTLAFGVAEWASAVALERRTLERRANALWGFGPAERLRRLKLDRARQLMTTTTLGWDEVSTRCGYLDSAAFRRLFLARFGQTPGEYRRRFG